MELTIRFTARLTPEGMTSAFVIIVVVIAVLVARKAAYWPGTEIPAVLGTGLAAVQALRVLLPGHGQARLPVAGAAGPAVSSV